MAENFRKLSMQKIIVFTGIGGGGHKSVTKALSTCLQDDYQIVPVCLLHDVLSSFDPIYFTTGGKYAGEETYNTLAMYNQWWLLNLYYRLGRIYFTPFNIFMRKAVTQYLMEQNADMVISVIPIFNNVIMQAAQDLDIPFLLAPTDLDIRAFVYNLKGLYYKKFHLSLIIDDSSIRLQARQFGILNSQISSNGILLRSEFFEHKNIPELKKNMSIDNSLPSILLMMGSLGANNLVEGVQILKTLPFPCHILVCIGKHKALESILKEILIPEWVRLTILQETDCISDYMAISDLLISKSGSVTFCEAIHMGLPMGIVATRPSLAWEKFNHSFAINREFGFVSHNYRYLPSLINEFFRDPNRAHTAKNNMKKLAFYDTPVKLKMLIDQMLFPANNYRSCLVSFNKNSRLND